MLTPAAGMCNESGLGEFVHMCGGQRAYTPLSPDHIFTMPASMTHPLLLSPTAAFHPTRHTQCGGGHAQVGQPHRKGGLPHR
jgi:hypothetical protein